jgi:hypothetical protein
LPKNISDLNIEEKLKDQDSWQNSSRSLATINAATVSGHCRATFPTIKGRDKK